MKKLAALHQHERPREIRPFIGKICTVGTYQACSIALVHVASIEVVG